MVFRLSVYLFLAIAFVAISARAQSYSGDARKIGMGGIGYSENITSELIAEEREYGSIVIPLGLIQLLGDIDRFDPDDDHFDPILAMEYAANPIHFIFNRDPEGPRGKFVKDVVDADLNQDLNVYRGFVPTNDLLAEGLATPTWGYTFRFKENSEGSHHGLYVGAGPYISAKTDLNIDEGLTDLLGSESPVYRPNQNFLIADETIGQLALAVTGGYRARFAFSGKNNAGGADKNGIYVGANFHYLHGFRYENGDLSVRFDTDSDGLVTVNPTTDPVILEYYNSRSGTGIALDLGIGAVVDQWEFGFGANGIGNRINWEDMTHKRFRLESLFDGGDFVEESIPVISTEQRSTLPVVYIGNVAYSRKKWTAIAELSRGFQGTNFHSGFEYRFEHIEFRGGGRYGLERWHPSGGIGFNLSERFCIDVAAFGTTTNIERK